MTKSNLVEQLRLYLVLVPELVKGDPTELTRRAIAGGVSAVQLRSKGWTDRACVELGLALAQICGSAGVLFLVNDRVDIALASSADGVHLGVDDVPVASARSILGSEAVIGFSPDTDEQMATAKREGADYLGIGPVYGTRTKSDAGAAIGLDTIARRSAVAGIPVIGIGGIDASNARPVIEAGAVGVAVVSAIAQGEDPEVASRALRAALDK